jgi:hypothetical protein
MLSAGRRRWGRAPPRAFVGLPVRVNAHDVGGAARRDGRLRGRSPRAASVAAASSPQGCRLGKEGRGLLGCPDRRGGEAQGERRLTRKAGTCFPHGTGSRTDGSGCRRRRLLVPGCSCAQRRVSAGAGGERGSAAATAGPGPAGGLGNDQGQPEMVGHPRGVGVTPGKLGCAGGIRSDRPVPEPAIVGCRVEQGLAMGGDRVGQRPEHQPPGGQQQRQRRGPCAAALLERALSGLHPDAWRHTDSTREPGGRM